MQYMSKTLLSVVMAAWVTTVALLIMTPGILCHIGPSLAADPGLNLDLQAPDSDKELNDLLAWAISEQTPTEDNLKAGASITWIGTI